MARSTVLALLLLVIIFASQFEWKQQLVGDLDLNQRTLGNGEHTVKKEDIINEKIILLQEKRIQRLEKLVRSLQQQLLQCQGGGDAAADAADSLAAGTPSLDVDSDEFESMHARIRD